MVVVVVVRVKHRVHGGGFSIRQAADSTTGCSTGWLYQVIANYK